MNKELDLTRGSIPKVLTAFIVPMILGSLIQQLYTTADAVIVGQFAGTAGVDFLADVSEFSGEHQFDLGMDILDSVLYHEIALVGDGINLFELS